MATANGETTKIQWDDRNRQMYVGKSHMGGVVKMAYKVDLDSGLLFTHFHFDNFCLSDPTLIKEYHEAFLVDSEAPGTEIANLRTIWLAHFKTIEVSNIREKIRFDDRLKRMRITISLGNEEIRMDCMKTSKAGKVEVNAQFHASAVLRPRSALLDIVVPALNVSQKTLIRELSDAGDWEAAAINMWMDRYGNPCYEDLPKSPAKRAAPTGNNDSSDLHHPASRSKLSAHTIKSEPEANN
ncbi:hypothetical protein BCR34DRAFT_592822 [Clohesyomyces aquaticus]|uniref:Uncharacterized protein n=1 Tax=Clohesyomyces aquaticus TaxID=1231657 RepID=A0A1Y1YPJ7_9PLEO|nr:hypothetical protein BCR34DRAFT_592822 [Clohesyomyces aquaticus]